MKSGVPVHYPPYLQGYVRQTDDSSGGSTKRMDGFELRKCQSFMETRILASTATPVLSTPLPDLPSSYGRSG